MTSKESSKILAIPLQESFIRRREHANNTIRVDLRPPPQATQIPAVLQIDLLRLTIGVFLPLGYTKRYSFD